MREKAWRLGIRDLVLWRAGGGGEFRVVDWGNWG